MNKVKRILVKGSMSYNLGDDMFIKILANRYPNVKFELLAPKGYSAFATIPNVIVIGKPSTKIETLISGLIGKMSSRLYALTLCFFLKKFFKKHLSQVDAFVIIGGSLFKEAKHSDVTYYINEKTLDWVANKPSFILGANFGPYVSDVFFRNYHNYFCRFTDVCFRDLYSYNLFSDLKNTRYHKDIIFQNTFPVVEKDENEIGFVVVDFDQHFNLNKYKYSYEQFIIKTATYYTKRKKKFTLIAFQKNEENYLESLKTKVEIAVKQVIQMLIYTGNQDAFLMKYGRFGTVFSTRFHSMILSFMNGQRNCPIIYNIKLLNFIKDIKYDGPYVEIDHLEVSDDFFLNIQNTHPVMLNFSADAALQFEKLDRIIS